MRKQATTTRTLWLESVDKLLRGRKGLQEALFCGGCDRALLTRFIVGADYVLLECPGCRKAVRLMVACQRNAEGGI